jgi:hypothetical protein
VGVWLKALEVREDVTSKVEFTVADVMAAKRRVNIINTIIVY